jgi:RNA polymerase sigma-70 factor (ECF subfamily)
VRSVLALGGVPYDGLDDGVQQVQVKLLEATATRSRRIDDVDAWVAVVASRVAIDWHRAASRDVGLRERLLRLPPRPSAATEQQRLLSLVLAEELDRLTSADRQLLVLRFFADLSVEQIAVVLDIPVGTAKSRLHRASGNLRTRLNDGDPRDA